MVSRKIFDTIKEKLDTNFENTTEQITYQKVVEVFSKAGAILLAKLKVDEGDKRKELSPWDVVSILYNCWRVVVDFNGMNVHYYIYDPVLKTYSDNYKYLETIVSSLTLDKANLNVDIDKRTAQIHKLMTVIHSEINYVERNVPPTELILMENGMYNWKQHEFYNDVPNNYHFTKRINATYPTDALTEQQSAKLEISKRILDDWSAGVQHNKLFLMEVSQAVIKGDSMKRAVILKSGGGDGKSTFMNILSKIIGEERIVPINMHKFGDDNIIGRISIGTQGIFGDDLSTKTSLGGETLSNLKSIISHQKIMINRKYLDAIALQTTALLIQATNNDINFMENTSAIADRFMMYNWPNRNFRHNPVKTFNLDELIEKDQEFIDMYVYYILTDCEYVEEFSNTELFSGTTKEMVEDTDVTARFKQFALADGFFDNYIIPTTALTNLFKKFEEYEHTRSGVSAMWLGRELRKPMEELGFQYSESSQISAKQLTPIDFDVDQYVQYIGAKNESDVYNNALRHRYYKNDANKIDEEYLNDVRKRLLDDDCEFDVLGEPKLRRALRYLAKHELNSKAQSILGV